MESIEIVRNFLVERIEASRLRLDELKMPEQSSYMAGRIDSLEQVLRFVSDIIEVGPIPALLRDAA